MCCISYCDFVDSIPSASVDNILDASQPLVCDNVNAVFIKAYGAPRWWSLSFPLVPAMVYCCSAFGLALRITNWFCWKTL